MNISKELFCELMYLKYDTDVDMDHLGSFTDPKRECHVYIYNSDETVAKKCSMDIEDYLDGDDINEILEEIEYSLKSYASRGSGREDMLKFINDNRYNIELGTLYRQEKELLRDIEGSESRLDIVRNNIKAMEKSYE